MPPKNKIRESRLDFSGGLNISAPIDALNTNELRETTNVRVEPHGGLIRRLGSRRLNTVPLPALISGVYQWFVPALQNTQLVAISSTVVYGATSPYNTFAALAGGVTANPYLVTDWAEFKDSSFGSFNTVLYFAMGGVAYRTDGITIVQVSGTNGVPFPTTIRAYGSRLFMNSVGGDTTLYWSKLGNGSDFGTGSIADGGSVVVGTDPLKALETLGSSLLIGGQNSIARFTGIGADIQLLTNTFGVSADVGPQEVGSMGRVDQFALFNSQRGPFIVTEGGTLFIGEKINSTSPNDLKMTLNRTITSGSAEVVVSWPALIGHNRRRKEIWIAYAPPDSGAGVARSSVVIYNYQMQCWYGRFKYPFGITCFGIYKNADGVEGIMAGCDDGYIRALDDLSATSLDDDGSDFTATVQFAPFGIGENPFILKDLDQVFLQTLGLSEFVVTAIGDLGETEIATYIP